MCIRDSPYYVACQFHPEFKSRPEAPSPPFLGLVLAATGQFPQGLKGIYPDSPPPKKRAKTR